MVLTGIDKMLSIRLVEFWVLAEFKKILGLDSSLKEINIKTGSRF
jgi:hypothetical protein